MSNNSNFRVIPITKIGNNSNPVKSNNSNGVSKATAVFLIMLLPICFLGGYLCSRYYQINFIDGFIDKSEVFSSKLQFNIEIQRTTTDIYLIITNCEFSHPIVFSEYNINDRKSIMFNMTDQQDLSLLVSRDLYQFFNLGVNNTNIICVRMVNSVNVSISKSVQFAF